MKPGPSTSRARRDIATRRSAPADVPRGHPPEFECRGAGCHDRVLRGEVAQCLLVIGLDNRDAVRVVVSEDRSEHDHVVTFEVRAPVGSVPRRTARRPLTGCLPGSPGVCRSEQRVLPQIWLARHHVTRNVPTSGSVKRARTRVACGTGERAHCARSTAAGTVAGSRVPSGGSEADSRGRVPARLA
jgi:hypothetical protein